jgi:serine/threonine protein kinase
VTLAPGGRLGPYAISSALGAGGMGEVYKACDTRLDRTVALKVLPQHVADNAAARERFQHEARAISHLQHPHICTLYDVGHQDGIDFLVLEYLEGETLSQRIRRGPLPLAEVLTHALQIADALDRAHRAGFVHCDLKPSNVVLTRSGVKLLDFGLAILNRDDPPQGRFGVGVLQADTGSLGDEGVLMGSVPYMAPEQLDGRTLDARTDIFAFGVVLYEMLTGQRPFETDGVGSTIAAILSAEPRAIGDLQPAVPTALVRIVSTCLARHPDDRWQTAADLKRELRWIAADVAVTTRTPHGRPSLPWRSAWLVAGIFAVVALLAVVNGSRSSSETRPVQFTLAPPEGGSFSPSASVVSVSPDGRKVAFLAVTAEGPNIWLESLESGEARQLPGTNNALAPFWSPDSRFVGFYADNKLKIIDATGGLPQTVCDAVEGCTIAGTWNQDGVILFSACTKGVAGIYRVSVPKGAATPVRVQSHSGRTQAFSSPQFLPNGRHFIYHAEAPAPGYASKSALYVGALDSPNDKLIRNAESDGAYVPPGYLLFRQGDRLLAQRFDATTLELSGQPMDLAHDIAYNPNSGRTMFSVSKHALAYRRAVDRELVWFDRGGHRIGSPAARAFNPALSPDDSLLATSRQDPATGAFNIWVADLRRGVSSRVTFATGRQGGPVWSPDGRRILFGSNQNGRFELFQVDASGAGSSQLVVGPGFPLDWSADGRFILYREDATSRLLALQTVGNDAMRPFELPFDAPAINGTRAALSPDAGWIAYTSNEASNDQVFVRPFPKGEGKWQVSARGGSEPRWRRDGKELFYLASDGQLMAVPIVARQHTLEIGSPTPLFATGAVGMTFAAGIVGASQYDVTSDGQRFLVNQPVKHAAPSPITVVVNWRAAPNP